MHLYTVQLKHPHKRARGVKAGAAESPDSPINLMSEVLNSTVEQQEI